MFIYVVILFIGLIVYFAYKSDFFGTDSEKIHVRGARFIESAASKSDQNSSISIGGVPIPDGVLTDHLIIAGGTGSGKSVAMQEILDGRRDGSKSIITDSGGEFLRRFFEPGDIVLNQQDVRDAGWNPFAEIETPEVDFERLAHSVIPDDPAAREKDWAFYARNLLADLMESAHATGIRDPREIMRLATAASREELTPLLTGRPSENLLDLSNDRFFGSVRGVASQYLRPWRYLSRNGDFSIRKWIREGEGTLWITYRDDSIAAMRPLISSFIDIAILEILSGTPTPGKINYYLITDELDSLGTIPTLTDGNTRGRKYGLASIAAIQSISQLETRYGRSQSRTLLQTYTNSLTLIQPDPEDAKYWSERLGDAEVIRAEHSENTNQGSSTGGLLHPNSHSSNNIGRGESINFRQTMEKLVLPSELSTLPKLAGVLKLSGEPGPRVVRLTRRERPDVTSPFEKKG